MRHLFGAQSAPTSQFVKEIPGFDIAVSVHPCLIQAQSNRFCQTVAKNGEGPRDTVRGEWTPKSSESASAQPAATPT